MRTSVLQNLFESRPQWPNHKYEPTQSDLYDLETMFALRDIEVSVEVLRRKLIELKQQGRKNDNSN